MLAYSPTPSCLHGLAMLTCCDIHCTTPHGGSTRCSSGRENERLNPLNSQWVEGHKIRPDWGPKKFSAARVDVESISILSGGSKLPCHYGTGATYVDVVTPEQLEHFAHRAPAPQSARIALIAPVHRHSAAAFMIHCDP
jgi:hypothetical protein